MDEKEAAELLRQKRDNLLRQEGRDEAAWVFLAIILLMACTMLCAGGLATLTNYLLTGSTD